jgi:hypothetical protein
MAKHIWKVILAGIAVVIGLLMLGGPADGVRKKPVDDAAAVPAGSKPVETRKTVGKTTQNVLDLPAALAQGAVRADAAAETGESPLGVAAQAYRQSVATIGGLAVEQKLKLHEAEHGRRPATYGDFMSAIIAPGAPDGIHLPMLPYYQEYAFDPETRGLVVVEFPEKKRQRERETTGASGL